MITRFKCNNQNQNSSNDVNNPNDENEDDSFDEDEEIPKINFFHCDVEDMLQVGEITLIKANDPVGSFYLLYMTKEQGVSLKWLKMIMATSTIQGEKLSVENI